MSRPRLPLARALAQGPLVLDGGLASQLEAQGCDLSDALWSARLLIDGPAEIEAAHTAYLRAGARVLISGSYQVSYPGFAQRGVDRATVDALLRRSVALARRAADADAREVWVAASVGPYGAVLADGSEYRGRYGRGVRELERFHRPRIEALVAAEPDVLALETVPDLDEAEAMLRAVDGCGVPVWLSYSVAGARTRAGQSLDDAFAMVAGQDQVIAVGVNCCEPGDADRAVPRAAESSGKSVVVYPNSGESWGGARPSWRGRPTFDAQRAPFWRDHGARLIGGCCRVGPAGIAELAAVLGRSSPDVSGPVGRHGP